VELYEVMRTTSAVRHFTNDPLPDEILYTILDNARFAPSGGNRQGTRIVIIRDPDTRQALVELTIPATKKYVAQRQAEENPWNTIYPSRVSDDEIAAAEVPESFTAPLLQAGVVLVVCVDLRVVAALDKELDRVGIVGGASVYPLVWNILLAARNEGLVERSRPWPWRKNRGSASYSGSLRRTPLPASFRWANPFTNHAASHGSTLQA
jgi:nitroreductase